MSSSKPALFAFIRQHLRLEVPVVPVTKATLVHLSHTLENIILSERIPAMIFTGFQESSYWQHETARYRELAGVARHICVFAGQPLPPESVANTLHIALADGDPLRQEWFLAILSDRFAVVLCGLDKQVPVESEGLRQFDTLWSFTPEVIDAVLNLLEEAIAHYQPDKLDTLRAARATYTLSAPDPILVTRFTAEIIHFEERLLGRLQATADALHHSEARYRSVVTNAPVMTLAADAEGRLTLIEGNRVDLLIRQPQALLGRSVSQLLPEQPAFAGWWWQALNGDAVITEMRFRETDFELHFSPMYDHNAQISGAICVAVDITARRQAEQALLESERLRGALEKEHELSEMKDRMMTTISHEFRTPLAIINSSVDLLDTYLEHLSVEKRRDRLGNIRQQVARLADMLDDLSVLVENTAIGINPDYERLDLNAFASDLIGHLQRGFGAQHHLLLQTTGDGLDQVRADPRLLQRILTNLLLNAINYSPVGSEVHLNIHGEDRAVTFIVRDQGMGIPQNDIPHIFEPFHRGANVGTTRGTGVGLTIVRDCVEAHGGHISVASELGVSTEFTVRIPRQPPAPDHA